jgi:hypothetical protein
VAEKQYNPLDKLNLGRSVAEALLDSEARPLGAIDSFDGAGIYAIYYGGPFGPYAKMAPRNTAAGRPEWPIYIGKAIPAGGRKGAAGAGRQAPALWRRLQEHAETIREAANLEIEHFQARYLTVDDVWIPLAESLLIDRFRPVWNLELDGFGNHDPGAGRYKGLRPLWDVLHPGRPWADRCRARTETPDMLIEKIAGFLAKTEPPANPHIEFDTPA